MTTRAHSEPVALAGTRWTRDRSLGVPLWTVIVIFGVPALLIVLTHNIWWGVLVLPLLYVVREVFGEDQNRARLIALGIASGQAFANLIPWGGASRDPLDV